MKQIRQLTKKNDEPLTHASFIDRLTCTLNYLLQHSLYR